MRAALFDSSHAKATQLYKATKERVDNPARVPAHHEKVTLRKEAYSSFAETINLYRYALRNAESNEQRLASHWNVGMASLSAMQHADDGQVMFHCENGVENFFQSLNLGVICGRDVAWRHKALEKIQTIINCATPDTTLRVAQYERGCKFILAHKNLLAAIDYRIAETFFGAAILLQEAGKWTQSTNALRSVLHHVAVGLKKRQEDLHTEFMELHAAAEQHTYIAISSNLLASADLELQRHIHTEENISMDMMWHILDMYFHSMVSTREKSIEVEATAASRIGRMYDKVFKLPVKAHLFYRKAYELGMSLQPRDVSSHDWFKEALKYLEHHQATRMMAEDAKDNKWKEKIKEQLTVELEGLNQAKKMAVAELLTYLYKTHPPKGDPAPTIPMNGTPMQRVRQAIVHYHPDKQLLKDDTKKWYVLCEEITKVLTSRYDCA